MPSAPSKVQVSTYSTGANEKHQDCSCRNDNYPLQLGGDFSTFPAGNVSLKSRPNNQLKKNQLSQCPQVLIGEKHQISSCIKEELCKAHVWSLVFQGQLQKSILESCLCLLLPGCCGARHPPMGMYGLIPKGLPLLHLTHTPCKAGQRGECALGHFQGGPVAKGDVPTNIVLDFFEWRQGWSARAITED